MKKFVVVLSVTVVAAITAAVIFVPTQASPVEAGQTVAVSDIPENLMQIFTNSCMPCHSSEGKGVSVSMLNFNEWSKYSAKKKAKKAGAICKVITKGSMPPAKFIEANPEKIVAVTQTEMICKWAETAGQ
jgi:hypothetical protein